MRAPYYEENGITVYHGRCEDLIPDVGNYDLLMTDPPYKIDVLPESLWGLAPCAYVFGDKRKAAEHWFRQAAYPHKDFLVWYYKNSPKPRGGWRMSMQAIIYGWRDGVGFNEEAARLAYTPAAKLLNGRARPSSGRLAEAKPYDTSRGALPRDVIEWPALLGHLSRERVGHADQKPLGLIKKLINTVPARRIIDPYCGSGTSLVAATELGLAAVGIDSDEQCCEMTVARLKAAS